MKNLWNNAQNNKNFARNYHNFLFQNNLENNEENLDHFNWPTSTTTNREIDREVGNYKYSIAKQVGGWNTTASVSNAPIWSDYVPPRVDGMFSRNAQRFWRLDVGIVKSLFPETQLANHIVDSLEGLNIANGNAIGRYTNISNALHQQLEATVRFARNGRNIDDASLFTMDMVEHLAKEVDSYRQNEIKKSRNTGQKVLKHRSTFLKFKQNVNPLNWPNARHLRRSSQRNSRRSSITTKQFLSKAEDARNILEKKVEEAYKSAENHRKGWDGSYANDVQKAGFYNFIRDVIANPNGFLNNTLGNPYDFEAIFGTPSRVRVLDVIILKDYSNKIIEEEKADQYSRDMTANLSNLNAREQNTETSISTLRNGRIENFYNRLLPDSDEENPANVPTDEELANNLTREIIRVERHNNINFDINVAVFGGQPNKMQPVEKISYLLNYITDPANNDRFAMLNGAPANFAGLSNKDAGELKAWLKQFREEKTESGVGLSVTEWATLQTNARDITNAARNALQQCTGNPSAVADSLLANNHGNIPTTLAPIKSFINSFDLFKFEETINKIDDNHKGIFTNFANQMSVIRNTLSDMVSKIETAHTAENARMTTPIPGSNQQTYPNNRVDLAVGITMTLNQSLQNLLNTFFDPTNANPNGVMAHNHPGGGGTTNYNYNKLRVHLSSESKKSRETQFDADLTLNSLFQWEVWQNALEGKVIPLIQGEHADYVGNTSHTLANTVSFSDLMIVENRTNELVLQDNVGHYTYILKPEGERENARLMLYKIESDVSQHGVDEPKETVSIKNSKKSYVIYNLAATNNPDVNFNPQLNAV